MTDGKESKPVMTRLPMEMYKELEAIAKREAGSVAAVLRRLARERLDQMREDTRR